MVRPFYLSDIDTVSSGVMLDVNCEANANLRLRLAAAWIQNSSDVST